MATFTFDFQRAMDDAAEKERAILTGYNARSASVLGNLDKLGTQQRTDLTRQYADASNRSIVDLQNRGLYNTTIAPSIRQGMARESSDAMNRLNDQLLRERTGYESQLTGDTMGAQLAMYQSGQQNRLGYGKLSLDATTAQNQTELAQQRLGLDTQSLAQQKELALAQIEAEKQRQAAQLAYQYSAISHQGGGGGLQTHTPVGYQQPIHGYRWQGLVGIPY
jgi:hypothetical protein